MNEQHKIKILALFGESGTGKSTIQRWIVQNIDHTNKIVPYTTRPKREYEVEGEDYFFVTPEQFEKTLLEGEMIEATSFNDWFYGTPFCTLERNKINIGVFNITGIEDLLTYHRFNVLPVRVLVDEKMCLLRALNREAHPNCHEICRRFLADQKDFIDIPFEYAAFDNSNEDEIYNALVKVPQIKSFLLCGQY